MDLSAAFDTVDHEILLTILKCKFGLEHDALKWFDRYLRPRSYKVIVNGKYSRERLICKCASRKLCRSKHIQPVLHPPPA